VRRANRQCDQPAHCCGCPGPFVWLQPRRAPTTASEIDYAWLLPFFRLARREDLRSRSVSRNGCAAGVSAASRRRMINIVFYLPSANLNLDQNTLPGALRRLRTCCVRRRITAPHSTVARHVARQVGAVRRLLSRSPAAVRLRSPVTAAMVSEPCPGVRTSGAPIAACARMASVRNWRGAHRPP